MRAALRTPYTPSGSGRLAAAILAMRRLAAAILALSGPAAAVMAPARSQARTLPSPPAPLSLPPRPLPEAATAHRPPNRITPQLVMTAKEGSLDDLPERTLANVHHTLALNPELRVRFLNDSQCAEFIGSNYPDLLAAFIHERVGAYRGDICRAAVIAVEGGFYADLDVQFLLPFSHMVDHHTTFMSAFDSFCNLWNAIFAAEPGSLVMNRVIHFMEAWYRGNHTEAELMGTRTFYQGLEAVVASECPVKCGKGSHPTCGLTWKAKGKLQFLCGTKNSIRLYREKKLTCGGTPTEECPEGRMEGHGFFGLRFGIFEPGKEGKLVGWSRFENCSDFGCKQRRMQDPAMRAHMEAVPPAMTARVTQQDLAASHCS